MTIYMFTEDNHGQTIHVEIGSFLSIHLLQDPSPYRWVAQPSQQDAEMSDGEMIELVSETYAPPTPLMGRPPRPGDPGLKVFIYRARAVGTGQIKIVSGEASNGMFLLNVTITE